MRKPTLSTPEARALLALLTITLASSAPVHVEQTGPPIAQSTPAGAIPIVLLRRSARPDPDKAGTDVLRRVDPARDDIANRTARLMAEPNGYSQFVLRLNQRAKAYRSRDGGLTRPQRAALAEPAYLFLSDRQGGFPAESFWLEQPDGSLLRKGDVPFVDTVVDEHDLMPGRIAGVEAIYAHELGHLMLADLAGPAPSRASTGVHFVTVKTDAWTAFNEGWGEHFQPMSLDHDAGAPWQRDRDQPASASERIWYDRFTREQVEGCWICPANLRFIAWQSPAEQRQRDLPVRRNAFVRRVSMPAPFLDGRRPAREARMFRDTVPPPADGTLKNGPEMMESEGVIATLFYRLASDERLRRTYREAGFYEPFMSAGHSLPEGEAGLREMIAPAENVYLKLFAVFHRHFRWGDWPAIDLVRAYATRFPDEAAAVYDVFLGVTRGVTVERAAYARHAEPGYLPGLRDRLIAGDARIDGNMGRPLWVVAPGTEFGMGLFRYFAVPMSVTFDLNAADVADLCGVTDVSPALAAAIVRTRDERGAFESVETLASVPGMTTGVLDRFRGMRSRMEARMNRPNIRRTDAGFMKDYLVMLLKGSYYVAALWQFGRALVLAGLAVLLTGAVFGRLTDGTSGAGPAQGPRRRWWRRAIRALGRGMSAALVPCLVSVLMYSAGMVPSMGRMALAGVAAGAVMAAALIMWSGAREDRVLRGARLAASTVVASIVIGSMY